jgi:Flp pilus assembly pilin Flp
MLKKLKSKLLAFHRDEQGADMVEYILIIAAIVLPILAIVIFFRNEIKEWMYDLFGRVQSDAEEGMEN